MLNAEIGVIAPDEELYSLVGEINKELPEKVALALGYLDEGVDVARQFQQKGVKVLVSRGGTTTKIRNSQVSLPIIDIPITEYDVIRVLDQGRKLANRLAVIGFDSLIKGADVIAPILKLNVEKYLVQNEREVKASVEAAQRSGIPVIIGAKLPVEYARKSGIHGILIKSQKPAVGGAIKEAFKVLAAVRTERELAERLKILLDSVNDGIISVDNKGQIMHLNNKAVAIIKQNEADINGKNILEIWDDQRAIARIKKGQKITGEIRDINNTTYICDFTPINVNTENLGAIISLRELSQLQDLEHNVRRKLYQKGHLARYEFKDILRADNSPLEKIIEKAGFYAEVDSTILIQGESGTGKEMFVQSIHNTSKRKNGPFVAVNCTVLPENLLESELFGYAEGAFTGAKKGGKPGLFELAHNGTLFLDEIGEISEQVQARLLRVLEEKQIMRVGDDKVIPVNVRIICATNKNLRNMVERGKFREDLYYRINILRLELPPLRERRGDIELLVRNFIKSYCVKLSKKALHIDNEGVKVLLNYEWPGNIRELKNIVERLVIVTSKEVITKSDVCEILDEGQHHNKFTAETVREQTILQQEEKRLILKALQETGGNKAEAARRLGISKTTLWRRLREIDIPSVSE
ncbi:MAG: sigma 54-interacting transcriptional regulator [Peptococcaceae bacterium]